MIRSSLVNIKTHKLYIFDIVTVITFKLLPAIFLIPIFIIKA